MKFKQMQAVFNAKKIVSQRVCYFSMAGKKLPSVVEEATALLETIPEENPYDTLKTAIIKRIAKSNESMLRDLFNNVELGDPTPS